MAGDIHYQESAEPVYVPVSTAQTPVDSWWAPFPEPSPRRPDYSAMPFGAAVIDEADFVPLPSAPELSWFAPFSEPGDLFHVRPTPELNPSDWLVIPSSLFGTVDYHPGYWYRDFDQPHIRTKPLAAETSWGEMVIPSSLFATVLWLGHWYRDFDQPLPRGPSEQPAMEPWCDWPSTFSWPERGDSVRLWLTGANSDGGAQADPDAALGNYRSSTEASRVGFVQLSPLPGLFVRAASRANGGDGRAGAIVTESRTAVKYFAPGSIEAGPVAMPLVTGQTVTLEDGANPAKWVRVERTDATPQFFGSSSVELTDQFGNLFGFTDVTNSQRSAGGQFYRACMVRNVAMPTAYDVRFWVAELADSSTAAGGALGSSGAGTITGPTDAFLGWPTAGWARVEQSNGTLREIVYYASRGDNTLTVPSAGRARLGTSAAAGSVNDRVRCVPGVRIAWEPASPAFGGSVQTIADETAAPTSVTWSTAVTPASGVAAGDLQTCRQGALWIERDVSAGAAAHAKLLNLIGFSFTMEGQDYSDLLAGLYRVEDTSLERYELHIGTDAEPDLTAAPDETFTSLPHTTTATFPGAHTYYVVTNRRNRWNLVSQSMATTKIRVNASNVAGTVAPSAPEISTWQASASGAFALAGAYYYLADEEAAQADTWLIYARYNGTNPDPSVDTPVTATMTKADGVAKLDYTSATYSAGTVGKVLLRVRRSADSIDSASSDIATATADTAAPATPTGGVFWRKVAEQVQ